MEYCYCCVSSDEQGSSGCCAEAPGGYQAPDPRREAKRAWWSAKAAAPGGSQPAPAAKPAAPGSGKSSASAKMAAAGGTKPLLVEAAKVRELPSLGKRVADFGTKFAWTTILLVSKFFFEVV